MNAIAYRTGGVELLDDIEPLWRLLCLHHAAICPRFDRWFRERRFVDRKAEILAQSAAGMHVQLASGGADDLVGYCVSTLAANGAGEVDSIFVREDCRGLGVGGRLMRDSLDWLQRMGATAVTVSTVYGNDRAQRWYEQFGFAPRMVKMVMPE